eukprot:6208306-Pleurochrysis_carterae.AAC.2
MANFHLRMCTSAVYVLLAPLLPPSFLSSLPPSLSSSPSRFPVLSHTFFAVLLGERASGIKLIGAKKLAGEES